MDGYNSTLTGQQVQERLNLVPEHATAIATLQQAITAFLNTEQVQSLISTALADYSTTSEMQTAITTAITDALTAYYTKTAIDTLLGGKVDKASGKQLSTEDFTTALKTKLSNLPDSTALATQISDAISTALADYYTKTQVNTELGKKQDTISDLDTIRSKANAAAPQSTTYTKTEVDNLLTPKQTAAQVSSAIATALTSYSTTTQMNQAISSAITTALASYYTKTQVDASQATQDAKITALQEAVAGLENLAEGYVRVAGSSSPALAYAHYQFNQEGAFSRESAFSLFYPCLVGTKLTGDDDQVGTVLHILQKLNWYKDLEGNDRKIDGSEGDVMVCNIEKYYRLAGKYTVNGTEYDVALLSREPFAWQGYEAEEVERFGWAPDYCVSHTDTDNVARMHSAYNPAWDGSYQAPIGLTGKYVFTQNEETGVITDSFDSTKTILEGAGGCHTTNLALYDGEQRAMNHNPDTTQTVPFMNQTAEGCNAMQALLLAEGGTFDAHKKEMMGSGFSNNDPVTGAADFEASGSNAVNGMRYVNGQDAYAYKRFDYIGTAGSAAIFGLNINSPAQMLNDWRNPWKVMEAQRAMSHAIENGVGELEWFVYEGNKYKYRSVPGFRGPSQGEMTCVVWKMLSAQFATGVLDPADGSTSLAGKRADFLISTALLHGMTTQVSPSWWTSGLVFTEDENGNYEAYMERNQAELIKTETGDIDVASNFNFETKYPHVSETYTRGEGYAKNYLNHAYMLPDTNANKTGAGLHTYIGKYNWFTGGVAPAGKKSVRGFRRGDNASYTLLSPLALGAHNSPSNANSNLAFGTCVRLR